MAYRRRYGFRRSKVRFSRRGRAGRRRIGYRM